MLPLATSTREVAHGIRIAACFSGLGLGIRNDTHGFEKLACLASKAGDFQCSRCAKTPPTVDARTANGRNEPSWPQASHLLEKEVRQDTG